MSTDHTVRAYIDGRGKSFSDYINAPLRNATLPHPSALHKWMDAGLLAIDVDNDRLIAGPKA